MPIQRLGDGKKARWSVAQIEGDGMMSDVGSCRECGVPRQITDEHMWLNSGVTVLKSDKSLRRAFVESENLDPLFAGIELLKGLPIESLIVEIERKGTRDYYNSLIPREVKEMVRRHELPLDPLVHATFTTNRTYGLGQMDLVGLRYETDDGDYLTVTCNDPYSLPLALGDLAGACDSIAERYGKVSHKEVSPGVYEMTISASEVPIEPESKLQRKEYHLREGDAELERCSTCGGPAALSGFQWDLVRGVIRSASTGKRMAVLEPSVLDPLFEELEKELGDTIPRVVVEAQKRFSKSGFHSVDEISEEGLFRERLALRGMGNLRKYWMDPTGLNLHLDNACMHLMVVGMVQGLFELAFNTESTVEWELSEEGDLEVEVNPRT
jgi:hypothetical protein